MEWTVAAKRVCETASKRPSARTLLFTRSFSPIKNNMEEITAATEAVTAAEWAAAVDIVDIQKNRAPMEKKSSNKFPERPAAASLKLPKKSPSTRSTPPLTRNCAINTPWVTHLIKPTPLPDTTSSISSRNRRTWWSKREKGITQGVSSNSYQHLLALPA